MAKVFNGSYVKGVPITELFFHNFIILLLSLSLSLLLLSLELKNGLLAINSLFSSPSF